MAKLQPVEVVEYFETHLPYRVGVLLAHYRMTRSGWRGDGAQLNACFVASLVTARIFLNVLGISRDKIMLQPFKPRPTDVTAKDLGGALVDVRKLPTADHDLFFNFLKMADEAAAHFTVPIVHDWRKTHDVILLLHRYLTINLYACTGHSIQQP